MACLTDEWMPLRSAQEVSGLSRWLIEQAAARGEIKTIPSGGRAGAKLYSRADLLKAAGILK